MTSAPFPSPVTAGYGRHNAPPEAAAAHYACGHDRWLTVAARGRDGAVTGEQRAAVVGRWAGGGLVSGGSVDGGRQAVGRWLAAGGERWTASGGGGSVVGGDRTERLPAAGGGQQVGGVYRSVQSVLCPVLRSTVAAARLGNGQQIG